MNLNQYEDNFFRINKQKTDMLFQPEDCVGGLNLPSKRLFEVKSSGNMSCLELSLQWLGKAQKNGICVMVDSEFNCTPEQIKRYNVNPKELLYVPVSYPQENYAILYKLLTLKDIRLIVLNSCQLLFPLVYDIKEFTTYFTKLKECVQQSEASVVILNPYYDLGYKTFSELIYSQFSTKYEKKLKNSVKIAVKVKNLQNINQNKEFSTVINYIQ